MVLALFSPVLWSGGIYHIPIYSVRNASSFLHAGRLPVRVFGEEAIVRAAACGAASAAEVARLVAVVDAGVARPRRMAIPASAAGSRFPQLCLRKLYVLCSRGAEAGAPQGCLLQVCLCVGDR